MGLEAGGRGEKEGLAEGGFEFAGGEPGGRGGEEHGVSGEERWVCGDVFGVGSVCGEDGYERGGEVGRGLVEQVCGHRFMVTRGVVEGLTGATAPGNRQVSLTGNECPSKDTWQIPRESKRQFLEYGKG